LTREWTSTRRPERQGNGRRRLQGGRLERQVQQDGRGFELGEPVRVGDKGKEREREVV
jgi:hypothetical protein